MNESKPTIQKHEAQALKARIDQLRTALETSEREISALANEAHALDNRGLELSSTEQSEGRVSMSYFQTIMSSHFKPLHELLDVMQKATDECSRED